MNEFTHVCYEQGNGLPNVGDEVLVEGVCGLHRIMLVAAMSQIHTRQWRANLVYVALEDADRDYDDLDEDEADCVFEDLHHVWAISGEAVQQ